VIWQLGSIVSCPIHLDNSWDEKQAAVDRIRLVFNTSVVTITDGRSNWQVVEKTNKQEKIINQEKRQKNPGGASQKGTQPTLIKLPFQFWRKNLSQNLQHTNRYWETNARSVNLAIFQENLIRNTQIWNEKIADEEGQFLTLVT
jgi:hypothetical protein